MKTLYLDESGDHDLFNLDPNYPVFVLGGCILDQTYHDTILSSNLAALKHDLFGKNDIILHYAEYTRDAKGFEKLSDKTFREQFYSKLNNLFQITDFTLVACVIDKQKHRDHYINPRDPYLFSLEVLVEKFIMTLKEKKELGTIVAESRNPQLDNALNLAFLDLKINGTRYSTPTEIASKLGSRFYIREKKENVPGLQLIDSMVTPIGRRYLNLKNRYIDYNLLKTRFRQAACGRYLGFGLVILPRK